MLRCSFRRIRTQSKDLRFSSFDRVSWARVSILKTSSWATVSSTQPPALSGWYLSTFFR